MKCRIAFTAVEMVTVMAIFSILAAMAIPSAFASMRLSRVNQAVGMIQRGHQIAMQAALTYQMAHPSEAVTSMELELTADTVRVLRDGDPTKVIYAQDLAQAGLKDVEITPSGTHAYVLKTGFLTAGAPIGITVRTLDQKASKTITIHPMGVVHVQ